MNKYTCRDCAADHGWHYDDEGRASRCPNYLATKNHEAALKLTSVQNAEALKAALAIVKDFAETHTRFSSNDTRAAMQDAGVPSPIVGVAYRASAEAGVIEACGTVRNTDDNTRHRVYEYRSLIHPAYVADHCSPVTRDKAAS